MPILSLSCGSTTVRDLAAGDDRLGVALDGQVTVDDQLVAVLEISSTRR